MVSRIMLTQNDPECDEVAERLCKICDFSSDAGNALQLLEFCSTFGKILDVKKGLAEPVLRDLFKG